jgi:cytochrome c peroxidase
MKLHLCSAGIALLVLVAPATAAETEAERLKAGPGTVSAAFINTGCAACHNGVLVGGGMYQKFGVVEDYWIATGQPHHRQRTRRSH